MTILITILIVLTLVALVLLICLINKNSAGREEIVRQSTSIGLLQQQLEAIRAGQDQHSQNLDKNLKNGQQTIDKHLFASRDTLAKLQNQLGELKKSSQQILQVGDEVRNLQDIFKNPKLRGQTGEKSLEKLLSEILPNESFKLQHQFKNGKIVDSIVNMPNYCVPIDAKFPLPTFEKIINAETDDEKTKLRRQFQTEVINRIDEIADNYINPTEGTLDFALMYIPAENVYYETIIKYDTDKKDIADYAMGKKVIPVSPNLLYVYLMTIVMGLHGLQIEAQAANIRKNLTKLAASLGDFNMTWNTLGKHLRNAQSQYDDGNTRLNKFTMHLDHIQIVEEDQN